jgi:hypothetical protein
MSAHHAAAVSALATLSRLAAEAARQCPLHIDHVASVRIQRAVDAAMADVRNACGEGTR